PGLERRQRTAALGDDQIAQPVEIRPSLHEVARVLDLLDELALAPLLDLERPGADAAGAVARRRHVSGVDRREAGGEHEQERRLRALETDDHRARIDRLDAVDVDVPLVPGIGPQLRRRIGRLPQHVKRVLDVRGAERPAVVPGDVAPQREHQLAVVLHRMGMAAYPSAPSARRSTIVGVPPSAVPNFAKSLTVMARRGFSDAALSANMSETATPRKFSVEGEQGLEDDERTGTSPRWTGDRGDGEGDQTAVYGGVQT